MSNRDWSRGYAERYRCAVSMSRWPSSRNRSPEDAFDSTSIAVLVQQQTSLVQQQTTMAADIAAMRADVSKALTKLEVMDSQHQASLTVQSDHESRLRSLERLKYPLYAVGGGGGVIGIVAGILQAVHH